MQKYNILKYSWKKVGGHSVDFQNDFVIRNNSVNIEDVVAQLIGELEAKILFWTLRING